MIPATSSCLASSSSSSSSAPTPAPQKQYTPQQMRYLVQTKEAVQGLRNRVLESPDVRRDLQVLGTAQEESFLKQKEQIVRQAGSLQMLAVARVVASNAYDEFLRRVHASQTTSSFALAQSAALMQKAAELQRRQVSSDVGSLLQAVQQFQAQIQTLNTQIEQLPSLTSNVDSPDRRKKVQIIFAAWIVQNGQATVDKMRDVAKSAFDGSIKPS